MQKSPIAFCVLCHVLAVFLLTGTAAMALGLSDLPPAAQETIQSNLNGRTVGGIETKNDNGDISYHVELKSRDGEGWDLTVGEGGKLLSIDVTLADLPPVVQTAITTQVGQGKLDGVARQSYDGQTTYLAGITDANGNARDFTFAGDGSVSSTEASLTDIPDAVKQAVNAQVGQGKLEGIDKTLDDGEINYDATMTNPAGQERNFTVDEDGVLVSKEVILAELPPDIQKVITDQVGSNKLTGIDETFSGAAASYDATMVTSGGQMRDFSLSLTGKLISHQVFADEVPPPVQDTITRVTAGGTVTRIDLYFGAFPHYEIQGRKDGAPFDFKVGPKGKFRGMEN